MKCLTTEECDAWRNQHSRRRAWKRQATFTTPLERLPAFVRVLAAQLTPFHEALLVVDQVVFDVPPQLIAMRERSGESRPVYAAPGHVLGPGVELFQELLEVVLSGWIDFRVLFSPPDLALRADHDEYTTVFSVSPGKIADVQRELTMQQVKLVSDSAPAP